MKKNSNHSQDKIALHISNLNLLPKMTGPKYVSLGFNKTGTTTLAKCFELLDLTPVGNTKSDIVNFKFLFDELCYNKNIDICLQTASHFRSLHNRPWNVGNMFYHIDKKFPGSKFFLTVREPEIWWQSVNRWLNVQHYGDSARMQRYLTHLNVNKFEKNKFIDAYNAHNEKIMDYFSDKDNLLVLNFETGSGWSNICSYLKCDMPNIEFPHVNKQPY